jgi:hypothetical protein
VEDEPVIADEVQEDVVVEEPEPEPAPVPEPMDVTIVYPGPLSVKLRPVVPPAFDFTASFLVPEVPPPSVDIKGPVHVLLPPPAALHPPWHLLKHRVDHANSAIGAPFVVIPVHTSPEKLERTLARVRSQSMKSLALTLSPSSPSLNSPAGSPVSPMSPVSPGSPAQRGGMSPSYTLPRNLPKYDGRQNSRRNTHLGMAWQLPHTAIPAPRPAPVKVKEPYPDPAHFVVCDHHCVRRAYPVIRLHVKNTSAVPVTVASHQHFVEVPDVLEFDRKRAYG